jgi:sulfite exporter TauE/SafE
VSGEFTIVLAFMTGVFGAFHCLGMCSGIASGFFVHYGGEGRISPHLVYHGTRILVYTLLGASGAAVGQVLVQTGIIGKAQGIMFILAGLAVILIGLRVVGLFPAKRKKQSPQIAVPLKEIASPGKAASGKRFAPLIGGLLNGFVPCSLVFSVAIKAISSANPLEAAMLMLAFGLGTWPTMLSLTLLSALTIKRLSGIGIKLAGVTVIALGIWTLYEGIVFFDVMRGLSNF